MGQRCGHPCHRRLEHTAALSISAMRRTTTPKNYGWVHQFLREDEDLFTLLLLLGNSSKQIDVSMSIPATRSAVFKARPVRVLLVEDHIALAEATAQFLREAGLHVEIAHSGQKALEIGVVF